MRALAAVTAVTLLALWLAAPRPVEPVAFSIAGVIAGVVIAVGLAAAGRFSRGALFAGAAAVSLPSQREAAGRMLWSALLGAVLGAATLSILVYGLVPLEPALAARLQSRAGAPAWMPLVLAFTASVLEEVVFRLFLMSGLVWLVARGWRRLTAEPPRAAVWFAIIVASLAFGLVHLPAWLSVTHPTPLLIGSVLGLNGVAGIALGIVYWHWGLEAAIVCHFFADLIVQSIGPRIIG